MTPANTTPARTTPDPAPRRTQHTPGPWKASRFDEWEQTAVVLDDHQMPEGKRARRVQHIATVSGENCWPNARLVAAAPDLLADLEAAESALCDIINSADNGAPYNLAELIDLFLPIQASARAAIAKAKGEG
jgi:hypothetical protein